MSRDSPKERLDSIYTTLGILRPLLDTYMIEFFSLGHWGGLPSAWRRFFDAASAGPESLPAFLLRLLRPPLSPGPLLSPSRLAEALSIEEEPANPADMPESLDIFLRLAQELSLPRPASGNERLPFTIPRELSLGLKPKKAAELSVLVPLLREAWAGGGNFRALLDVGAGVGHLSRVAGAAMPGLRVVSVDGDAGFVERSEDLDRKTRILQTKRGVPLAIPAEKHRAMVNTSESNSGELGALLGSEENFCIAGLHTCGDLSPAILREFLRNPRATAVVSLSCCYHKLNAGLDREDRDDWGDGTAAAPADGYPLSRFGRAHADSAIGYSLREMACHGTELFQERLQLDDPGQLKVHQYRAALEQAILSVDVGGRRKRGLGQAITEDDRG